MQAIAVPPVNTANAPAANEFARFTDADTLEGRTAAEVKADLGLGTIATQNTPLGVTVGGTGLTALTANRVPYATATDTLGTDADLTFDGTTLVPTALQTPTINGGTAANDDITIQGTSHATRTTSNVFLQPNGGYVAVGPTVPLFNLHVSGPGLPQLAITDTDGGGSTFSFGVNNTSFVIVDRSVGANRIWLGPTGGLSIGDNAGNGVTVANGFLVSGRVGVATQAPDKALEVNLGTADAVRLTYNDANGSAATYMDTTLSSAGVTTFTGAGSAPAFSFAQAITSGARINHASFTVGTAPAVGVAGGHVYFADAAGSPCWGQSNGSVWKRCDDTSVTVT